MKTIQSYLMFLLLTLFAVDTFAQENESQYVIQVATYGSWGDLVDNKDKYTSYMACYTEKVGKRVKVYVLDHNSEYGFDELFFAGERLDNMLDWTKSKHKGAFRRSDVSFDNLTSVWEIFEQYEGDIIPTEYTSKGGNIVSNIAGGKYTIQLGAFKEKKSPEYIANHYGFSEAEKEMADKILSYDFKKINKKICRRYFFGQFDSKADAVAKMRSLEKNSKRKMILVEIQI